VLLLKLQNLLTNKIKRKVTTVQTYTLTVVDFMDSGRNIA